MTPPTVTPGWSCAETTIVAVRDDAGVNQMTSDRNGGPGAQRALEQSVRWHADFQHPELDGPSSRRSNVWMMSVSVSEAFFAYCVMSPNSVMLSPAFK